MTTISDSEVFTEICIPNGTVSFKSRKGTYLSARPAEESQVGVVKYSYENLEWERWTRNGDLMYSPHCFAYLSMGYAIGKDYHEIYQVPTCEIHQVPDSGVILDTDCIYEVDPTWTYSTAHCCGGEQASRVNRKCASDHVLHDDNPFLRLPCTYLLLSGCSFARKGS